MTGKSCAYWNEVNPVHKPKQDVADWVERNNITHNTCINFDNDDPGPFCYTTDPNQRWELCGICDPKFDEAIEYERGYTV